MKKTIAILGGGNGAVGDGHALVVGGGQLGVGQADLLDGSALAGDLHIVTGSEGLGVEQCEATEHVCQQILEYDGEPEQQLFLRQNQEP